MNRSLWLLLPAALAALFLAGCGPQSDHGNSASQAGNIPEEAEANLLAGNNVVAEARNGVIGGDGTGNAADAEGAIVMDVALPSSVPAQFHGRWGRSEADCAPAAGDAPQRGLLQVSGEELRFATSSGFLERVLRNDPQSSLSGVFAFPVGPERVEREIGLNRLAGNRLQLRMRDASGEPLDQLYSACPPIAAPVVPSPASTSPAQG